MNIQLIRQHKVSISILIFLFLMCIIHFCIKPYFIYNHDGSFRQFGLGNSSKTVIPIWVFTIVLAIISYLSVLYYITYL